mmetsp:Transcript_51743/g.124601  ORF Transcript_51743/g.124601 Transcript_51743/m.124601 type:complete len:239 (-) Transcript_51743:287-1003(-)
MAEPRRTCSSLAALSTEMPAMSMPMPNLMPCVICLPSTFSRTGLSQSTSRGVKMTMATQSATLKKEPESWKPLPPIRKSIWHACSWYQNCMELYSALNARFAVKSTGKSRKKPLTSSALSDSPGTSTSHRGSAHGTTTATTPTAAETKAAPTKQLAKMDSGMMACATESNTPAAKSNTPPENMNASCEPARTEAETRAATPPREERGSTAWWRYLERLEAKSATAKTMHSAAMAYTAK